MSKPIITENERRLLKNRLYNEYNFNTKKLEFVDELIDDHLKDSKGYGQPKGVDPEEVREIDEKLEDPKTERVYNVHLTEPEKDAVKKLLDDFLKLNK